MLLYQILLSWFSAMAVASCHDPFLSLVDSSACFSASDVTLQKLSLERGALYKSA